MKIIADLHLHSRYSRAVSGQMILSEIAVWAGLKGIDLIATGDFTHPLWSREIKENLKEVSEGLFKLKDNQSNQSPLFILQAEISSIYTQGGIGRRIHNLVYTPSIKTLEKINQELTKRGANLLSDGRPIINLSSPQLCELIFGINENCLVVPAHVWTPWYSLYGSKSGFNSIEECFGEYAKYIYGIETGLSSDPAMNWRIKELENRAIISSSDAHSGPKLGREVTIFETATTDTFTYKDLYQAIKTANYKDRVNPRIAGTIEFYPEEGKYHYTGHRDCKVRYSPEETRKKGVICPVCGKSLTVGVMHRVEELSGVDGSIVKKQDENQVSWVFHPENKKPPYTMLVPLFEIIAEVFGGTSYTQNVKNEYNKLTNQLGSEFQILLKSSLQEIQRVSGEKMAEAIKKVRAGEIAVLPGFDGEFGTVSIFSEKGEKTEVNQQEQLGIFP